MATRAEIDAIKAQQAEDLKKKEADAGAAAAGKKEGEDDTSDDNADAGNKKKATDIDYEAELKLEKARREKAEQALADDSFKKREESRKRKEAGEVVEDEVEKPLTASQLQKLLEEDREKTRKELQADAIKEKAAKLSRSEAEASLIIEIHKNRQFPQGMSLDEQLEEALAIANKKNTGRQISELKRALVGKHTEADHDAGGSFREGGDGNEPKMAPQDQAAIKQAGFVWDGKIKLYKKALNNGKKTLFYDPKNSKRWVQ